jgi:hypothetical protein
VYRLTLILAIDEQAALGLQNFSDVVQFERALRAFYACVVVHIPQNGHATWMRRFISTVRIGRLMV